MPQPLARTVIRWVTSIVIVIWQWSLPLYAEAETSIPIPRPSSTVEKQIHEETLYLKEETVSIASRYEQPISKAPSDVYVITDEDIRNSGSTDIPTLLRQVPGMEVMQVSGADYNVSVRGNNQLSANKLLLMVDGRSIYVDVQGVNFWQAIPITLPEIKRIEVLKGPASVLYGFNAFDGVINIITKSPDEIKGATVQVGGGEYGTLRSAAVYASRHQQFSYRLSYGHDQNQQWRNRNAPAFRDDKFNVHTEYALSGDSKLSFSGGLVDVKDFDGNVTAEVVNTGVPALGYAHASYDQPNFFVRAFWNRYDINGPVTTTPLLAPFLSFTDRNFNPNQNMQGNTYNIEAQRGITLGDTYRLTLGINYRHNTLSSNFIDRFRTEDRMGFYLQNEWKPSAWLQLVGGLRYDLDTSIHPTISPRGSLIFTPLPNHTVRATAAVGYRPPTMFETYAASTVTINLPPPFPPTTSTSIQGDRNLDPEKIVSYELAYQGWYFQHRLKVRTAGFFNHISDLILQTVEGNVQGGVADIYGGEAGLEFLAAKWLSGFGNMAYQEIGQTFGGTAQRAAPRFKWNAGLRGQWENGLSGEIAYHYVGDATYPLSPAFLNFTSFGVVPPDTRVGHYQLLNVRAAYRFWREEVADGYRREAEVALSVFNALNDNHREHPLGDLLGTRVLGWLTVKL